MKTIAIEAEGLPEFVDLPYRLHANDPQWVPPIRQSVLGELTADLQAQPQRPMRLFLCRRDGRAVARIAAIIDPRWTDSRGNPMGQLGYFESVDEEQAGASVVEAGLAWLREQGVVNVRAPINGGAHRTYRFMRSGFERDPFLFEPRNPPHYPRLFESLGFEVVARWTSFDEEGAELETLEDRLNIRKHAERVRSGCRVEPLDLAHAEETLGRIYPMLDDIWKNHPAYVPISFEEFLQTAAPLLSLMKPRDFVAAIDSSGRDLGFLFVYPDYVDEVRALRADARRWGEWPEKPQRRRLVMHTVGVRKQARRSGAAILMLENAFDVLRQGGYEATVIALVIDGFRFFQRAMTPTREYALYGRSIQTSPV